jgi:hypothetical protein
VWQVAVGSWVRDEQGPLALKWRLRNEGTKNSEISIEMKNARVRAVSVARVRESVPLSSPGCMCVSCVRVWWMETDRCI